MTEEVNMFDRIISRITKNRRENRELRANDEAFKTMLVRCPGRRRAGGCNGRRWVCGQAWSRCTRNWQNPGCATWNSPPNAPLPTMPNAPPPNALTTCMAEQQLIAEKLGLLEIEDEPAEMTDDQVAELTPTIARWRPIVAE